MTNIRPETSDQPDSLEAQLDTMKRELDALQIHVMRETTPWHKQVPVVVPLLLSVAALGFSFWSAAKGEGRLNREEHHQARGELRDEVQRLQAIPLEIIEIERKYKDDSSVRATALSEINTERRVIAQQAADLTQELKGDVTAPEYYAIVGALFESGQATSDVELLIQRGLAAAKDAQSAATLYRYSAQLSFEAGNKAAGRDAYEHALGVIHEFPRPDQRWVNVIQGQTQTLWAEHEAVAKECRAAWRHVVLAQHVPGYRDSVANTVSYVTSLCPRKAVP
jgi:hypothetical protein